LPSDEELPPHQVSVVELSDTMAGSLRNMAAAGPGVCPICWTFHDPGYDQCAACVGASQLDVVIPISYALRGQQLATALRGYKDEFFAQTRAFHGMRLAAILWRFLAEHERHVAAAARTSGFGVVTVVPSKTSHNDDARRGLRTIAGTVVEHTAPRFERLLRPTDADIVGRYFDPRRYSTARRLDGESVLLIDDTWVTGSSAQSAGAALREAGAAHVGCVVIGRWLRPDFGGNWGNVGDIYNRLPKQFDWSHCAAE
jgi:predicted amidophosphoribosyltransferase